MITGTARPVAIQGRVGGAKGIWLLHPDPLHQNFDPECDDPPRIWIRGSQLKIKYRSNTPLDRSLRILDLVRLPRVNTPSSLYMQSILNMHNNGVGFAAFEKILNDGLKSILDGFANWTGPKASICLAKAVADSGKIMGKRLGKAAGVDARLRGFIRDENPNEEDEFEDDEESLEDGSSSQGVRRRRAGVLPFRLLASLPSPSDSPLSSSRLSLSRWECSLSC